MCDSHNDTTYNGWANWATWNTALWFANDEGLYRQTEGSAATWTAAGAEAMAQELLPNGTPDMDSAAEYSDVDWQAIADAWNEE